MDWIDEIASDDVLRQAYDWLCERRVDYSPNDDVWDVRWRWEEIRPALQDALRAGDYRMSSVRRFSSGRETIEVWSALNALVLKATSIVIAAHCLPELSMRCYHIEGRGGAKAAVRFIDDMRGENTFVFRTDVKSYYASWVILAPTRWKLRAAIRLVNETLAELKVEQHPDKTFIGRIRRGFDFLGYVFSPTGLEVAPRAVEHCVERVAQLYL